MKSRLFIGIVLTLALAACQAEPAPTEVAPTETEAPALEVVEPTETEQPPAEVEATAESERESPQAYQIVSGETSLTYEVGETFINQNNKFATAIGVTREISGEIILDVENPQNSMVGVITADVSQFKSDSNRRDKTIRERFLESIIFPLVTFEPVEISGLPESYQEGQEINFQVTGETTIRNTTLPLTFDVAVNLEGDTLSGVATTTFLMSDFGFGPIDIAGILKTEDEVKMTFSFVARP